MFRTKQLRKPRPCHLCHQAVIKQASCCRGESISSLPVSYLRPERVTSVGLLKRWMVRKFGKNRTLKKWRVIRMLIDRKLGRATRNERRVVFLKILFFHRILHTIMNYKFLLFIFIYFIGYKLIFLIDNYPKPEDS